MSKNIEYNYKELEDSSLFTITFNYNKYDMVNQDETFNTLLLCIMVIANYNTLPDGVIEDVNKFLNLTRHNTNLDVRDYIKKE